MSICLCEVSFGWAIPMLHVIFSELKTLEAIQFLQFFYKLVTTPKPVCLSIVI